MSLELDKEEIAARQLDTAILLMFESRDIVSVHTLASASSRVFADLLEHSGRTSWREQIVACHPGKENEVRRVLSHAANFFKHADRDPDEKIEFDEITNDETIIVATLEYGDLLRSRPGKQKLSVPMSVFQMWYFAKQPELLLMSPDQMGEAFVQAAQNLFPKLGDLPRVDQLSAGARVIADRIE